MGDDTQEAVETLAAFNSKQSTYAAAGAAAGYVLLDDAQRNRLANAGIGAVVGYAASEFL